MRDSACATDTRNLRQPSVISVGLDGPMIFTLNSKCQHNRPLDVSEWEGGGGGGGQ